MRIETIFAQQLFAFVLPDGEEVSPLNELDRLLELWTDTEYLFQFAKDNLTGINIAKYVRERQEDVEQIQDIIEKISKDETLKFETFFQPLHNEEYQVKSLSLQKAKTKHGHRRNELRLYAIKIDENCFVITGGAIKLTQAVQEHPLTAVEFEKLKICRQFLKDNGVFDDNSLYEFIM
ncbi:MAG: hypothetical protein Q8K92_06620 [Leadbetterella sp.]|nr:hypothetical protein [Leadbetterella sp.]